MTQEKTIRKDCASQDLLADSNPMVVANAVAALAEIQEVSGKPVFQITSQSLFKLLRALNECTEWGQVSLVPCPAHHISGHHGVPLQVAE
jgi:vesicle coat complex subunit